MQRVRLKRSIRSPSGEIEIRPNRVGTHMMTEPSL